MKYELVFNGRNFLVRLNGRKEKRGFFKKVRVEADTLEEAELQGVELLRADEELLAMTRKNPGDDAMLFLDSHRLREEEETLEYPTGAIWYSEKD